MTLTDELNALWQSGTENEKRDAVIALIKSRRERLLTDMRAVLEQKRHGLPAMYFFSDGTDVLTTALFHFALQTVFPLEQNEEPPALIACGGYGRRELAPYSDIDVLFLTPSEPTERQTNRLLFIVYLLWDAGIKIGYAVRTVDDSIDASLKDATIRTNLLESRFVAGNESLFGVLSERYREMKETTSRPDFIAAKRKERDDRYARMGESRYMLEPNVKEGRGGLRDLHLLFWLMKYLFDVTDLRELVGRGILDLKTVDSFLKAHDFLDTVRCYLHFYNKKRGDILTMQAQQAIAPLLGYADRENGLSAVERFMKHYYIISKSVGVLMHLFTAVVEDEVNGSTGGEPLPQDERFFLDNGRVSFKDGVPVTPDMLLKVFWLKQTLSRPIAPSTLQTATARAKDVRAVRRDVSARALFLDVLTAKNAGGTLHRMLDSGILGEFVPVFKPLIGQMQFDMYHFYTTDEHTLKTIDNLPLFQKSPFAVSGKSKRALYVAALLHDTGKGMGGNHAEKGAVLAVKASTDLGLTQEETETVVWLVRHHLLMSETAFKRDIFDEKTVADFVASVQSPERLRLLFALTAADIAAVGPNVWNGFKERLLTDLFKNALGVMQGDALKPRAPTLGQQRLLTRRENGETGVLFDIGIDKERDITEFAVAAPDREGFFAAVTGAMALTGVSVVGAEIATLRDGTALDSFLVQDTDASLLESDLRTPLTSEKKIKRLTDKILRALENMEQTAAEVAAKRRSAPKAPVTFQPRVFIDNDASNDCSLIEVNGTDCVGFLHAVTHTMTKLRLTIVSAHIYTYGTHVVDVFYVKDAGGKLTQAARQTVAEAVMNTLERLS